MARSTFRFPSPGMGASLAALAIASVAVSLHAQAPAARGSRTAVAKRRANPPIVFGHTLSDLAVDPAARFGRLPNGMTYVVYKSRTPPGAASVWMRVDAGSVMEQDDQRGLAHFIEHMAFKGSKNVPEGEMVKLLERDGLQFGADTNAQTSFFETIYTLNLPNAANSVVDHALFLMRETAGNIRFDPRAIQSERGVILGEERARATVDSAADEAELKQLLPGTTYAERMPIGKVDVLMTAQLPAFLRFYNDFYRPEYTTLIVVGDVDANRIEAEIRRRFADWRPGPRSTAALTNYGALVRQRAPRAKTFVADGLTDTISTSWVAPPSDRVETKAKDFDDGLFAIANSVLSERYARAAKSPGSAFAEAGLIRQDVKRTARVYSLKIRPKDGLDRAAFAQAMSILREYLVNGPTQRECDRALLTYDRYYTERATTARTVPSSYIAGQIVQALSARGVLQSPAQEQAEFAELKPVFTVVAINALLKRIELNGPPLLWRQGESAATFDEPAMLAAHRAAIAAPVSIYAQRASVSWPYTDFGVPGAVVAREALSDLRATRVTFANGVVLTVKQTDFEDNAIHVAVQTGNGLFGIRPDQGAALFIARQVGLDAGGLGKLSSDEMREALAGKMYELGFTIGNDSAILSGSTTKADFDVQMQVLAAFATDPAFHLDAFERVRAALPSSYAERRTSPDGVYATKASGDLYGDDPRFATPTQAAALAVHDDQVAALLKYQLGHGPLTVTIVGDIAPDTAIAQVAATFGAMPALPAAIPSPGADRLRFPTTDLHRVYTHDGRADQNISVIAWPTTDYYTDPRRAAALDLLAAIMSSRELEEVRGKQSAAYSASANSAMSRYFSDFGFIISRATVRPEVDDTYYATMTTIADALKTRPVTADELSRARLPLIDRLHNEKNANGYWLALLSGRDGRRIAAAEAREHDLLSVTADDIRMMAQTYLDMTKAMRIQIKPTRAGVK